MLLSARPSVPFAEELTSSGLTPSDRPLFQPLATIAINEQRFAPNIKNVVSTDSHGEVISGNIGEFLKYIPGVDAGGGAYEPGGILIRGFPEHLTEVTSDGAPLASSGSANAPSDRAFSLSTVSINNVSRVEVTKMPTPATRANSSCARPALCFALATSMTLAPSGITISNRPSPSVSVWPMRTRSDFVSVARCWRTAPRCLSRAQRLRRHQPHLANGLDSFNTDGSSEKYK